MGEAPVTGPPAAARWPDLFVVGAMKAGTTSLVDVLDSHPSIAMSPIKEPNHFGSDIPVPIGPPFGWDPVRYGRYLRGVGPAPHQAYVRDVDAYLRLFSQEAEVTGEGSVSYLYSTTAIREILDRVPHARFVVALRDPVARALSHHRSEVAIGRETERNPSVAILRDLERTQVWGEAFLYVGLGQYGPQMERLMTFAGRTAVLPLFFDDLSSDPGRCVAALAEFLGVDSAGFGTLQSRNIGVSPRFHRLNHMLRRSGIKGVVSRLAPRRVVGIGKRVFYRSSAARHSETVDLEAALRPLFAESDARLWDLLGTQPRWPVAGAG